MNATTVGRIVALVLFSAVGALVIFAVLGSRQSAQQTAAQNATADLAPPPDEPSDGAFGGSQEVLAAGKGWSWTVTRSDGSVAFELTAERVDPEAAGRLDLEQPKAWVYLDDVRLRAAARSGHLIRSAGEPQSGRMDGGVLIEVFDTETWDRRDAGGPEPPALATVRTEALDFEATLGQIEAPGEVTVESDAVTFQGAGLLARVGDVDTPDGARQRLNYLRIAQGREARVSPSLLDDLLQRGGDDANDDGSRRAGEAPPPEPRAPRVDLYRLLLSGDVRLSQAGRSVNSSEALLLARLVDGRFRDGAIKPLDLPVESAAASPARPSNVAAQRSARGEPSEDEIVLQWSGPLELRLLPEAPTSLDDEDLFVRFASPETSVVEMADEATGATARAAAIAYGFTTRSFALSGVGGVGVRVNVPDVVELAGGRIDIDLSRLPGGVGAIPSPGAARRISGAGRGEITWEGRADFTFSLARRTDGDGLAVVPGSIAFDEAVSASEGESRLRGDHLRASFSPIGPGEAGLASLAIRGGVAAESLTESGMAKIDADAVTVLFDPASPLDRSTPIGAQAEGDVRAEHAGRRLRAGRVETTFASGEDGRLRTKDVLAEIGVALATPDGLRATADRLDASVSEERADLMGAPALIEQARAGVAYAIEGSSLRIEGAPRRLTVFGRGAATYETRAGGELDEARVEWADGMVYEDLDGVADVLGSVVATRAVGARERQIAEADHALIRVEPYTPEGDGSRELIRITLEGEDERPASVESRRYRDAEAPGAEPTLDTLVALRAARIIADHAEQRLETPGAGLLLVEDRRAAPVREPDDVREATRGTSVFEWDGRMLLDRTDGLARMDRNVRVRHLHPDSEQYTELVCESVEARLDPTRARDPGDRSASPEVQEIVAREAVYMRHTETELVCDELRYRASSDEIVVTAIEPNRITVLDREEGRHFTASQLFFDLVTGAWRASEGRSVDAGIGATP